MAIWKNTNAKSKQMVNNFSEGVNTYIDQLYINAGEIVDCLNMSSDAYPAIEVRDDRDKTDLPVAATPILLGKRSDTQLHIVDDTTWKYSTPDGNSWTTIATTPVIQSGKGTIVTFKTQVKEYSILGNLEDEGGTLYAWDGSSLTDLTSNAPKSNMYTAHKYRLYGIESDKRTLTYSTQGDITDWTTSLDAGSIDVTNAQGDITAIRTFQDHVIVWANNSMHELYGTSANDFVLVDVSNEIGCINQTAHVECNGQLFWLDYSGIYLYTGGIPIKISNNMVEYIDNINWDYKELICCGFIGNKIFYNIPYDSTVNNRILVYDTMKQKWMIESGNFVQFINLNEKLYGLDSEGYIWDMVTKEKTGYDDGTLINWNYITKPLRGHPDISVQTSIRETWIDHNGTDDSTLYLGYTLNISDNSFTDIVENTDFTASEYTKIDRKIMPIGSLNNFDYIQFKFYGEGYQKINSLLLDTMYYGNTD